MTQGILDGAVDAAFAALGVALLMVFVRLVRGPTLADRVVALDAFGYVATGFIALHVLDSGATAFLDAAVLVALFAFIGTLAFARHVEHGRRAGGGA